eukprot:gene534-8046_t
MSSTKRKYSLETTEPNKKIKTETKNKEETNEYKSELFSDPTASPDESTKVILMLGLSQNGKSSTANTLLQENLYPVGDGNTACTKDVTYEELLYETKKVTAPQTEFVFANEKERDVFFEKNTKTVMTKIGFLDCPGIGDSNPEFEEENMKKLFSALQELKQKGVKLSSIILCIKSTSFFNENQEMNFKYYLKMFSKVFETCLSVVVTELNKSKLEEEKRKREHKRPADQQIEFLRDKIKAIFGFKTKFPIYGIDNYCLENDDIKEKNRLSETRQQILNSAANSKGFDLSKIGFPKTKSQLDQESKEIAELRGQLKVHSKSFELLDHTNKKVIDDEKEIQNEISAIDDEISQVNRKVFDLNSDKKCLLREESKIGVIQYFGLTQCFIDENFSFKVTNIEISEGYYVLSEDSTETNIIGVAYGSLWRSYNPTIRFYTLSKYKNADLISNLLNKLVQLSSFKKPKTDVSIRLKSQIQQNDAEIKKIKQKMSKIENRIEFLEEEFVKFED